MKIYARLFFEGAFCPRFMLHTLSLQKGISQSLLGFIILPCWVSLNFKIKLPRIHRFLYPLNPINLNFHQR